MVHPCDDGAPLRIGANTTARDQVTPSCRAGVLTGEIGGDGNTTTPASVIDFVRLHLHAPVRIEIAEPRSGALSRVRLGGRAPIPAQLLAKAP